MHRQHSLLPGLAATHAQELCLAHVRCCILLSCQAAQMARVLKILKHWCELTSTLRLRPLSSSLLRVAYMSAPGCCSTVAASASSRACRAGSCWKGSSAVPAAVVSSSCSWGRAGTSCAAVRADRKRPRASYARALHHRGAFASQVQQRSRLSKCRWHGAGFLSLQLVDGLPLQLENHSV